MPASWFPPRLCSHTSLPVFTPALVLLLSCSWPWEGEVGIPAQPSQDWATGALVTWNSCVRLLCPALQFPSRNRSAVQPTVQNTQFQHWLSCCVCLPFLKAGVSLEHLPPVDHTREETMRTREGWAGDACFTIPPLFFPFCLFLTCLIVVYLFSDPLSSEYLWPSATPGFRVAKEREECENLAGLQSIVLLYNTVPFSPLSLFLFPFQVPVIQQKSKPFGYDFVCVFVLFVRFM